jgi:serine/threonine-protein kinase
VEQQASALAPGFRLDRYELLCPIAQGGMAEVWLARQTGKHGFEKTVAVKTILPKFADDDGFQRMFLDEAHVSSRIEHPNVAQILDVGQQDDITYLVMEYVDGDALSTLHREAERHGVRIPHGVLLRLMIEVCGGLHAAHELRMANGQQAGVVHRDVSPHNILVTSKGAAKLIDFGLAKARDRLSDETSAGTVKGKLRYMAPEQVLGPSIDRRADVWAVGATLYHLLSGQPPYEAETDVEVVRTLMSGAPPRPLGRGVHPAVEAVVMRSLAWQADQRFATALDFERALEQAARHTRLEASASDVAAFVAEHLRDRAQQRQEAMALGLRGAAEREGVAASVRTSAQFALLSAKPGLGRVDSRPPGLLSPPPMPPPSSGYPSAVSNRSSIPSEPAAPRSGSWAFATAVLLLLVFGVAGLVYRRTHPLTGPPTTGASYGPPAAAVAPARPASAGPAPVQAQPAGAAGSPPAESAISMTVSVTDLPVATASAARPRVVPRPQPRIQPSATTAAPAGSGADDTAAGESDDGANQGQ